MDNDFTVDIDDVIATLRTQDVVIARFVTVGRRLLIDFRSTPVDPPIVRVVDPVRSVDQRYAHLRTLRPRLPDPRALVSIFWPRFAASFAATGAWDVVLARIAESGHPAAVRAANEALEELVRLEHAHQREAITGAGPFRTLWSAAASHR